MRNFIQQGLALRELLRERILVLDGAMGTMLQQSGLTAEDFGGPQLEGCNEYLVVSRPDVVSSIHRKYLEAGSDIIETNSFGSTPVVLAEYGLGARAREISKIAAALARKAADDFSTPTKPRFVAGAMGPTTKAISVTGGITFEQLRNNYFEQAHGLIEGGADVLLLETCQDTRNIKAGILAIQQLGHDLGQPIPLMISVTIEAMGTMLAGQSIEALWSSLDHVDLISLGLNCATGPEFMTDHVRTLQSLTSGFVSCYPNAGLPNEEGLYHETPGSLAQQLERFVDRGWLNIVGGCCGTTEQHIRAIAQMVQGKSPRRPADPKHRAVYSGIEIIEAEESTRPLIVGERTNVIGSRQFKNLVATELWEEATEIARRQVKSGAHIVDVCLQSTDRDEIADIPPFYDHLIRKIKAPIMIDTTDPRAVELALTYCQGKSIINSINLEDGEEKFERVCPLARSYGAAVIVGCIDEDPVQAQAFTRERKLEIAERSHRLLTERFGIHVENIIFDPLVFPCGTGDKNYIGGALETIEGVRLIKKQIPHVRTVLGISNVSFGLPPGAREVVNSVFLYHCTKAGLDLAIVNAERIERFGSIPEAERKLAEDLLFNTPPKPVPEGHPQAKDLRNAPPDWREQTPDQKAAINQFHITAITDHFRASGSRKKERAVDLPLDQRLANYILEGSKDGLVDDLNRKRAEGNAPLDIINGPLMTGMAEVGRLFNNNELIVAEVLQSAEAMKAAVSHLEQFMEKADTEKRAKVMLATVKGDVHDIGKNLVEIILKNNGYEVINLGIKVPPEELIRAHREHNPDAIGLSGLLVKSAQQMVTTATDLREAGIDVPLLVGGAALSEKFTRSKIAPQYATAVCYAKDAMTGLRLMNHLSDPAQRQAVLRDNTFAGSIASKKLRRIPQLPPVKSARREFAPTFRFRRSPISIAKPAPFPIATRFGATSIPYMIFGRHMGFRGNFEKALKERDPRALELFHSMEEVKREAESFMKISAVWQFFEAEREGNSIALFEPGKSSPIHKFHFQRQRIGERLCLSDYILPPNPAGASNNGADEKNPRRDHLALFVVTAGAGVRERSEEAKAAGRYLSSHGLQALAIETAEACAEWLHRRIREDWGFPDPPTLTMAERFTSRYRGKRFSFGYPACPNLDDQAGMWMLLKPEEIGVHLTEGMMMDPEASVSALVFHHPDCTYFTVGDQPDAQ